MDIDLSHYHITQNSNLLRVRMLKVWDLAMTVDFCEQLERCIHDNLQQNWGVVADLRHWCLGTEEAYHRFYLHHQQCISLGLKYQAIILPTSRLKCWQIKAFVANDYTLSTYLTEDESNAMAWLARKGFRVPEQRLVNPLNHTSMISLKPIR